ncbi:MAG: hypothetical protein Fur003_1180 [Candidatus Dojkabacteria bacterium]
MKQKLKLNFKKKYEAQGFVEALISLLVAGLASIVLMSIAARTLKQVIQNDVKDQINEYAVNTGERLEFTVDYLRNSSIYDADNPFSDLIIKQCYEMNIPEDHGTFLQNPASLSFTHKCEYSLDSNGLLSRSSCGMDLASKQPFSYVCVVDNTPGVVLDLNIVTGFPACNTSECSDNVTSVVYPL